MKKKFYCIELNCNNEICYCNFLYGQRRCHFCANKDNKYGLKDGRCLKTYYCIDCGIKISINSAINGTGRCASCATKNAFATGKRKNHRCYCIDCGKQLKDCRSKRCEKCNYKYYSGKNSWLYGKLINKHAGMGKGTYYKNIWMRSSYEIAYAKFLDYSGIKWQYEPKAFDLGNSTYRPDFYIPEWDLYIEIKGYWRDDAKKKYKLFKKLNPKVRINVLNKKDLKSIGVLI